MGATSSNLRSPAFIHVLSKSASTNIPSSCRRPSKRSIARSSSSEDLRVFKSPTIGGQLSKSFWRWSESFFWSKCVNLVLISWSVCLSVAWYNSDIQNLSLQKTYIFPGLWFELCIGPMWTLRDVFPRIQEQIRLVSWYKRYDALLKDAYPDMIGCFLAIENMKHSEERWGKTLPPMLQKIVHLSR